MFSRLAQVTLIALGLAISNHANAAPLAYGTYYDESVGPNCSGASSCRANFSQVPADKLLMVQKIHCAIISLQPIIQAFFQISATSGGGALSRFVPMGVPPSQFINSNYFTSWETNTSFLVGQGRFPYVIALAPTTTTWNIQCTMIGELVTPL